MHPIREALMRIAEMNRRRQEGNDGPPSRQEFGDLVAILQAIAADAYPINVQAPKPKS